MPGNQANHSVLGMTSPVNNFILYAEDDENDAFLVQHAFAKASIPNPLIVVNSGKDAIEWLSRAIVPADNVSSMLPCLVLLDLNMPGTSGLDVLKWIRATPALAAVVVVMLTSSNQEADIHRAYLQGANGYLVKPSKVEELVAMATAIKDFWLLQNRPHLRPQPPQPRQNG
jgi:CheY-like chemotaxis protein